MRLSPIHIASILLILGFCEGAATNKKKQLDDHEKESVAPEVEEQAEPEADNESSEEADFSDDNLPILPPIILLDFDNGTDQIGDDKSKRTVDGNLGYGFQRNNILSGKYNYYFPAGKSGTTVSIEESVTPFLPKTIIERIPPSTERPNYASPGSNGQYSSFSDGTSFRYQYLQPAQKFQPVFGQRTKLHKLVNPNFKSQQTFTATTRSPIDYSTPNNDFRNSNYLTVTTPSPQVYNPVEGNYVTSRPVSYYQPNLNSQYYSGHGRGIVESSTPNPSVNYLRASELKASQPENSEYQRNSPLITTVSEESLYSRNSPLLSGTSHNSPYLRNQQPQFSNSEKYTVENGLRYENKIYWKYPDGRVTDQAPASYIETYPEYQNQQPQPTSKTSSQQQINARPTLSSSENYQGNPVDSNVYSQAPVQFPVSPETEQQPNPFISSESLATNPAHQQVYRLGYQSLVGSKSTAALIQQARKTSAADKASASAASFSALPTSRYTSAAINKQKNQKTNSATNVSQRPYSRYMVNSPDPEYVDAYTTPSPVTSTTPTSIQYATPSPVESVGKQTGTAVNLDHYSNLGYSDLLKYNPSISQYIKNPSSILNVRPTFVQAGNSLIPVVILRVDGAPPIQPKVTPNINLKALLQQYLLQYANNFQELARPSLYDLGREDYDNSQAGDQSGNQLVNLARLVQTGIQDPYGNNAYSNDASRRSAEEKNESSVKFGERTTARKKVKNVQIIEDPRYPPYREDN